LFSTSKENQLSSGNAKIDSVYHNVEWLITAFAGTLIFIIFVMQVYRIPTGSMAETLRGAHFRVRCGQCGYRYDHDFVAGNYGVVNTANPSQKLPIMHPNPAQPGSFSSSRCPSCGHFEPPLFLDGAKRLYTVQNNRVRQPVLHTVFKGDQIFVLKSVYQFFQPKRWDVMVFKNPTEPNINYIKRCVGLPGEELVIMDGDIFINGQIQRKPAKVQEELWMIIYNNDYQPAQPNERTFNGHSWKQPFENIESSKWNLSEEPTAFSLNAPDGRLHRIQYNDDQGNDFRATYGYDNPVTYSQMPICSDLMVQYSMAMEDQSTAGARIRKYGTTYQGQVSSDGTMELSRLASNGQPISLLQQKCDPKDLNRISRFRFATLDRQLVLEYGATKLVYDLAGEIDASDVNRQIAPQVQILGTGQLQLDHIALYRDIHYLSSDDAPQVLRGSQDTPMHLGDDEFFACGDNSPYSADSRMWNKDGLANNGKSYPAGVVPKDYLVGKAFVVHWPGGYRLKQEPIRWIPFPDGMKIIYGGAE
jgi:signal peptidase I